jgi:Protein of unknown function (DUF1499)
MKPMATALALLMFAIAVAAAAFFLYGPERVWVRIAGDPDLGPYDFATAPRSPDPNDALACTPGTCGGKPDFELAAQDEAPEALIGRFAMTIAHDFPQAVRVDDRKNPRQLRYVTYSPLMRYPDTTTVEAAPLPDGRTGLRAYAKAQLGSGDFGMNRKRLETWLADFLSQR